MSSPSSSSSSSFKIGVYDEDSSFDTSSQALFEAVRSNDVAAMQEELSNETINDIDYRGYTVLHIAVEYESFYCLKCLLKQPSILKDVQCLKGYTPLALACVLDIDIGCILELIEAGCNLDLSNLFDECPLWLLMENVYINWEEKKIVIEVMIENGVDLDKIDILKEFIRYYNRTEECLEVLHLFLYYNIDVNANGVEAFTFALKRGHFDICDILWDYIADFTINLDELLVESLEQGYKFNELIEKGANVSKTNIFEISDTLFALCTSRDANAIERLNYLCMRFNSHDEIYSFIENMNSMIKLIYLNIDKLDSLYVNRECLIRCIHLVFNAAFEAKCDLFYLFNFDQLYTLLNLMQLDKDEMIKIFFLYLMCISRIGYFQLYRLYKECSKELFETFLKVNIKIDVGSLNMEFIINWRRLVDSKFECILYPDLVPLDTENEKVPSLLKLSRNVIRKQFQPNYKTMINEDFVYFRYYNEVNKLDVPKRVKDILLLNV